MSDIDVRTVKIGRKQSFSMAEHSEISFLVTFSFMSDNNLNLQPNFT
jgi:hypothetical protein